MEGVIWVDLKAFIIQLIVGLGGEIGIAIIILKFMGNTLADRLSKKYELQLNKELEHYKNNIEGQSHVSKAKFDAIYSGCADISEAMILCFKAIKTITSDGLGISNSMEIEEIEKTIDAFESVLSRNMPIISVELYNKLMELVRLFRQQICAYESLLSETDEDDEIDFISQADLESEEKSAHDLLRRYYSDLKIVLD